MNEESVSSPFFFADFVMLFYMDISVLDLVPIVSGKSTALCLQDAAALAQHVEALGYKRFWVAEHHDMDGIGSSAPEVLIANIAARTSRLRVGSGGIMLPNHSTYHMAEVFRTLEALCPGRIDFGVGRAPGSGNKATQALRRGKSMYAEDFPEEMEDIIGYFNDELSLKAVPQGIGMPEIYILGSSDFGAQLAAKMGLPFAFAQHFSPLSAFKIVDLYRKLFRPSRWLDKPKALVGCHVIVADTDAQASDLALSSDLFQILLRQTGNPGILQSPDEVKPLNISSDTRQALRSQFPKFVGSPETIQKSLAGLAELADELVVSCMVHDIEARKHSYTLLKALFA